jgi:DNA-binding NtrC family response regulator
VNVRVICATHRDLKAMVDRGEFREDLYYRLRGITLDVPPLRARMGDLARICDHLLSRIALERGEKKKSLTRDAMELLACHRWPGNVRELENALRAASLFADDPLISSSVLLDNVDDLRNLRADPPSAREAEYDSVVLPTPSPGGEAAGNDADFLDVPGDPLPPGEASATAVAYSHVRGGAISLPDIKRQIERDCVARALAETRGNITRAAALLGMKRPRLSQLVKQYGLAAVQSEV